MSKLKLNKKTVSVLDKDQLKVVKGGGYKARVERIRASDQLEDTIDCSCAC